MHFTNAFAFALVFLSITSIESPLSPPTNVTRPDVNKLDVRQLPLANIIIDVALKVGLDILTDLVNFNSDMHAAQQNFTHQTIISLAHRCPGKNLLIFHNRKSRFAFSPDAVHVHHELELPDIGPFTSTRGYEIWVFDSGTFSLAGDGGYENWAAQGCFSGPSTNVVFRKCRKRQLEI